LYYNSAILKTEYRSRKVTLTFLKGIARNRWTGPDESGNLRVLSGQTIQTPRGMKALTSSERVYPDHSQNDTRSEDSILVSRRIRKENHINSLSAIEVFVSKLREEVLEFAARDKAEKKPSVPRFGRRAKVSRSPGLENLKVTLNLARGDLESSLAF